MKLCRGFTLLEMIVAISIFAVIAALSYGTLDQTSKIARTLSRHFSRLAALQLTFLQLQRDVLGALNRPVRDGFGDPEAALLSNPEQPPAAGEWLRLTTSTLDVAASGYQHPLRVAWRLLDHTLFRISWQVLDRDQDSIELRRPILERVQSVAVQFWQPDATGKLQSHSDWKNKKILPRAVDITISMEEGKYRRLLLLPDPLPDIVPADR